MIKFLNSILHYFNNDWKDIIDVHDYYFSSQETDNINFYYQHSDESEKIYCGATIQYSKNINSYRISYYGYRPQEHRTLLSFSKKLLCKLNNKNYENNKDVLHLIEMAFKEEDYELLDKIKRRLLI